MSGAEIYLNHLIDTENEYVIVDLTAGIDTLASGMFVSYDIVYIVVEPTAKSLSVFTDYVSMAKNTGIEILIYPIANQITNQEEVEYIEKVIGQKPVACLPLSPYIRKTERGEIVPFSEVDTETFKSLEILFDHASSHKKNWDNFYSNLVYFHNKKAGLLDPENLRNQIDPDFNINSLL